MKSKKRLAKVGYWRVGVSNINVLIIIDIIHRTRNLVFPVSKRTRETLLNHQQT